MILLLDAGNSIITIGVHDGRKISRTFTMETRKIRTKDEFALFLINMLMLSGIQQESITGAAIASVVPTVNASLQEALQEYFGIQPVVVGPGIRMGIRLKVDNPKEVGADLIADALAAHVKYSGKVLVVNCGTATKYSVISEDGEFMGVAIAPGFELGAEGLFKKTAQLPDVGLRIPDEPVGRNSVDAIASGLYFSYGGGIRQFIEILKSHYGMDMKVILTGGISNHFRDYLKDQIDYWDIHLTLEGLKIIYDKNTAAAS